MSGATISGTLWTTPQNAPTGYVCRRVLVPQGLDWSAIVTGALTLFANEDLYDVPDGHLTAQSVISELLEMWTAALEGCPNEGEVAMPVGSIFVWPSDVIPADWLLCDGTLYDQVDYPELYAVLDEIFYRENNQFRVPDLVHRFVLGASSLYPLYSQGGSETHLLIEDEIPAHTHIVAELAQRFAGGGNRRGPGDDYPTKSSGSTGGSLPHNNMPPYRTLNWVIVAKP